MLSGAQPKRSLGVILGTGPSLAGSAEQVRELGRCGALLFGCNNTFQDFDLDVWLACDPTWHKHYGQVAGDFDKWHWSTEICTKYNYTYIEGVWHDGLWMQDASKISLNHCSGAQLLNLACNQYQCGTVLLVGHDFTYREGEPRHYFVDLSDQCGEYPPNLRKFSLFDKKGQGDDLLAVYKRIAATPGLPEIINCTPNSALPWFPMGNLCEFM